MTIPVDLACPTPSAWPHRPSPHRSGARSGHAKRVQTALVAALLSVLTLILFAQEWITRRPKLWRGAASVFWPSPCSVLGWGLNGQLSVVQVVAFVHALLTGFRWETFLIDPGDLPSLELHRARPAVLGTRRLLRLAVPVRGLAGTDQRAAQRLGIRQIEVPQACTNGSG